MAPSRKQTEDIQNKIIRQLEAAPDMPTRKFSDFEIDQIRKYYVPKGSAVLAKALNKTPIQIINKATKLGLKRRT